MKWLIVLAMCACICAEKEKASADSAASNEDYYIDDDQEYFDKNETSAAPPKQGTVFKKTQTKKTSEETEVDAEQPPNCLKDCKGFPQGKDAFNEELQCAFVLGVKEGEGCANDCTTQEFDAQFSTMREFCGDTADSWDGACVADCPGAPGSKTPNSAFADDMTDKGVCSFLLTIQTESPCLADCKDEDFTEINSIRDQCQQTDEEPQEEQQQPQEHVSAVSSAVMVGGFTLEAFIAGAYPEEEPQQMQQDEPMEGQPRGPPRRLVATEVAAHPCETEPHWCVRNLPRNADGTPHANCISWGKDCPCTCKNPLEVAAAPVQTAASQAIAEEHAIEHQEATQQKQAQNGPALGRIGPAWTYDKSVEKPAGVKDMGTWTDSVYTPEQMARLGVDEYGKKVDANTKQVQDAPQEAKHRGEDAFISAMAHTLLVHRDEVDILNIVDRPIQEVDEQGQVTSTRAGIEIEFGVRFVAGAEEERKLVAEKLRSMSLGCMYLFSGRIHCDGPRENPNTRGAGRVPVPQQRRLAADWKPLRRLAAADASQRPEDLQQTEDPNHKAVQNLYDNDGQETAADRQEINLLDEFRFSFSAKLRKFGMQMPVDFEVLQVEKPTVVLFVKPSQQQIPASMQRGARRPAKKGMSSGAIAAIAISVFVSVITIAVGVWLVTKRRKTAESNGKWDRDMAGRFEQAKRATTSFSPSIYESDSPIAMTQTHSPAGTNMDEVDVDLDDLEETDLNDISSM